MDGAPRGRPLHADARGEIVVQGGERVRGGAGALDVEQVVDSVTAVGGVAGADGGAHMAVLHGEGDESSGTAGDVPGQGAAEPFGADGAVRVVRDHFAGRPERRASADAQ
ncbi:hypothetical protein [Streptomyces sp. NPDC052721]|uniref:hypothetical protein n=1 Tax=Streptomyces sp. NPDC052721 TaxID=3154955 RepID=UPI00341B2FF9